MENSRMLVWLIIALLGFNIFTSLLGPANTRTPPNPLISHTVSYAPAAYNDSASREENLHHKISEISPSGYVDPGLLQSSGVTQVFLIANDSLPIEEIAEYTLSCRATPSFGDLRLVMATMEVENIMPLAETRGMIALLKNRRVKYPISTRIPSLSTSASSFKDFFRTTPSPQAETLSRKPKNTMRDVAGILGANHTWQTYGIDGANTTIAIVDTGVDYGAFSLAYWDSLAKDVENKTAAFNADATAMAFTNITVEAYQTPQGTFIPTSGTDPYIYFPETPAVIHRFSEIIGDPWFADMNVTGIVAEGERCHFGLMFQWLFGLDLFPVLVVDGDHDGRYDTTYVDLSFDWSWIPLVYYLSYGQAWPFWTAPWPPDFSFTDELALSPEDSTPAVRDFTGDGIYDLSGGVLGYFLDIWSMAPNIYDRGLILEPIDPYGNYTCFVNDWFGHGTQCASSAAGRESLHPLAGPGIAPGAKIMGVVALWIGDIIEGELWAAGFDLIPRTRGWKEVPSYGTVYGTWEYTGRHKADIISNSWGWSDWAAGLLEHPWYDILTIFQDALTVPGYLDPEYPGTVITHAGGNGGPGYGTITEPAYGSLVLTVGAATSMHFSWAYGYAGGYHDDIISWSARGPSPLGAPKPDLLGVGAYGFVPGALWTGLGDGSHAWNIFGGTSMATPTVAGAAALVEEQHLLRQGAKPTPEYAKVILKSTAKDLGYDPLVQGNGQVDCYAAVSLANSTSGIAISTPSNWDNIRPRIAHSWQIANQSLGPPLDWDPPSPPIKDTGWFAGNLQPNGSTTAQISLQNPTSHLVSANITPVSYEPVGATEVISEMTEPLPTDWTPYLFGDIIELNTSIMPPNPDLMMISMNFSYDHFYPPQDYLRNRTLWLYVGDWKDSNGDGIVNKNEVYRINLGTCTGTTNQVSVGFPATKFRFTPVVYLRQMGFLDPIPYTIHIRFYERTLWDWITTPAPINIDPQATETLTTTLRIPPGTSQGVYQGQIIVNVTAPYSQTTSLPVSVNVPAVIPAETLTYNLRAPPRMRLYDSYRAQGYFDWAWRQESGDWKTWPINVTDPSTVAAFVTCNWTGRMTDIDMFGINPHETLIDGAPSPHLGNGRFQWRTRTGTTAEYLVLDTSLDSQPLPGVYKALLHNVLLDGTVFPEELRGRVQLVKLLPRGSVKKPIDLKLRPGEAAYAPLTLTTGKRLTNLTVTGWRSPISIVPITLDEIEAHSPLKFNLSAVAPIDTPEGIYPLTATITSTEIPFQIEISLNVTVDNTPPEASISLPEPGAHIRGTYEVEVTGDDPHLDRMELYLDHTLLRTWDTAGTQNFNLATPEYADGDYRIRILVYDETGNQAEDSVRVTIDNTPPEASILSPPDRTHLRKPHNITAYAFDSHLEKAELYLNDTLLTTWNTSRVQTRLLNTQDYIDGTYLIRLKVTDKAGDQTQDQVTIVIDNTPPTAHLIAPIQDIHLAEMYNITFTFQDDNLRNATLLLDRKPLSDIQDRNSYLWNTTEVLDGEHILTLAIIDEAGNSRTLERRVTVDNTLPTAEIREPSPNTHLEGSHPVVIHGHDTNLRLIELYLNQTRLSTWEQGGTKNYTWDTTGAADGNYTLQMLVRDQAGNSWTDTVTVTIDNTKPSVNIESPQAGAELSGTVDLTFTAQDTNLESAQLIIDDNQIFDVTHETHFTWDTLKIRDGKHTIKLAAYDKAGNTDETLTTVETVNVKQQIQDARNLYLGIGIPIGIFIGAILAYAILRRRS